MGVIAAQGPWTRQHRGPSSPSRCHCVLRQGSNGAESDGRCRKIYRFVGNPIRWLLFLKKLLGKVISEHEEGAEGRGGEQEQGPFRAVPSTRSLLAKAQMWTVSIIPSCSVSSAVLEQPLTPSPP